MPEKVAVVVPNWNGIATLGTCIDSLQNQSLRPHIIVVENGSADDSLKLLQTKYPGVTVLVQPKNLGFAGGVNIGLVRAISDGAQFVALFNNDAVAEKDWLRNLVKAMTHDDNAGIVTCKFMDISGKHLDSTGDQYTNWGLPYPRGRGEPTSNRFDKQLDVFAASGGASLYRVKMLKEIGLFDKDFFAYYDDVD